MVCWKGVWGGEVFYSSMIMSPFLFFNQPVPMSYDLHKCFPFLPLPLGETGRLGKLELGISFTVCRRVDGTKLLYFSSSTWKTRVGWS